MAFMVSNKDNLMVGLAAEEDFKLDVFNTECRILVVGDLAPKGRVTTTYFFPDNQDNAICIQPHTNSLICMLFNWGHFR